MIENLFSAIQEVCFEGIPENRLMFSFTTLHGVKGQPLPIDFKHLPGENRNNMSQGPYWGVDLENQCTRNKEILACFLKIFVYFQKGFTMKLCQNTQFTAAILFCFIITG